MSRSCGVMQRRQPSSLLHFMIYMSRDKPAFYFAAMVWQERGGFAKGIMNCLKAFMVPHLKTTGLDVVPLFHTFQMSAAMQICDR